MDADSVRTVKEKMVFVEGPKMASARRAIGFSHAARVGGVGWMVFQVLGSTAPERDAGDLGSDLDAPTSERLGL